MIKKLTILLVLPSLFLLTSCWDRLDIEENAFILGVGIDKAEEEGKVIVTFQIALPSASGPNATGQEESAWSVSIESKNVFQAANKLLGVTNLTPTFQHCQVLLFGEEYARQGIGDTVDFFFRNPNIRRKTTVAVIRGGEAKDALNLKVKTARTSATYLAKIMKDHSSHNLSISNYNDIGRLHINFVNGSPITLQSIKPQKDHAVISGEGVFKDLKLIGWFNEREIEGIHWIRGDIRSGEITISLPESQGGYISLNVFNTQSSLKPILEDGKLTAKCHIEIEGDIIEIKNPAKRVISEDTINTWEQAFKSYIKELTHMAYMKARDVLKTDTFDLDLKMSNYYPIFWSENKDQWDSIYKNSELDVDVEVKIRRLGDVIY